MTLTPRVVAWRERGTDEQFRSRAIHVLTREGSDPLLVLLHGFPSSSYDWRHLLELDTEHGVLAFDFLGFGLSDKPRDVAYSVMWQADLTEELVRRHGRGRPIFLVAHDMGTSVATELMARDIAGGLDMDLRGAFLFNGSILLDRSSPTLAQKLLRSPAGPVFARLTNERLFRRQFGEIFSDRHPLTDEEAEDQWALIQHGGGHRLGHRLVSYMDERELHAERWHGAISDWEKPLHFAWGMRDPVATPAVLEGLRELRPAAPVDELAEAGHYPQIELPELLDAALQGALRSPGSRPPDSL